MYLPRGKSCPLLFMQQILSNENRVLNKNEVRNLKVPLWPELVVHRIWQQAVQLPDFAEHMPGDWTGNHKTERPFFYGVLTSLAPEYVEQLIIDCRR